MGRKRRGARAGLCRYRTTRRPIKGSLLTCRRNKGFRDIDPTMIAMVVDEAVSRALPGRAARNPGEHSEARGRELAAALSLGLRLFEEEGLG